MNPTGTKTETRTSTIAMTGAGTSDIARLAASLDETRSSRICRSTFSTTTIASSTTIPIAKTIPNKVIVLMEKPSAYRPANVPINDTGTATVGIIVVRQL